MSLFPNLTQLPLVTFNNGNILLPADPDWAVNAAAAKAADDLNAALPVLLFDDTIEEGIGWFFRPPRGPANCMLTLKSRAVIAPGSPAKVGVKLYYRGLPDDGSVGTWSSMVLTDVDIPTNALWQDDLESSVTLFSLGIEPARLYQFELTRVAPGSLPLTGDWSLLEFGMLFHR